MGVDRILTVDLHAPAIMGSVSSRVVFEDFQAGFIGIDWFIQNLNTKKDVCIVAPDAGAVKRAKAFQQHFEYHGYHGQIGLALMHKERKKANEVD